ncbi:MAG: FIST N-terminal domain-containing protein [Polyangiales bacterium]
MKVFQGHSQKISATEAIAEATEGWMLDGAIPDLVLAFTSTSQDPQAVSRALKSKFAKSLVVGCTTAGEHLGKAHFNDSLVLTAVCSPTIRWRAAVARDLANFDEAAARRLSDELILQLGIQREDLHPVKHFSLVFVDGLSCKEELVSSLMAEALEGIPLLGGSAGDDLKFKKTHVLFNGEALSSAAVLILAESTIPFEIIKHQHYTTTPKSIVITRADLVNRRVYEIDGYPALEAYGRALGLSSSEVTSDVTFMNPLTFVCDNELYVRSIQRVETDGSMVFFCGIEEGMVLSIGGHENMESALARDIDTLGARLEKPDLFIACNCILRALEASKGNHHGPLGDILGRYGKHVIGFDTYGEQLSGLHINQTLVGIALRGEQAP